MNMFPMHVPARGGQFKFMTDGFCKHWHIKVVDNTWHIQFFLSAWTAPTDKADALDVSNVTKKTYIASLVSYLF